jgi:hypothetical protein
VEQRWHNAYQDAPTVRTVRRPVSCRRRLASGGNSGCLPARWRRSSTIRARSRRLSGGPGRAPFSIVRTASRNRVHGLVSRSLHVPGPSANRRHGRRMAPSHRQGAERIFRRQGAADRHASNRKPFRPRPRRYSRVLGDLPLGCQRHRRGGGKIRRSRVLAEAVRELAQVHLCVHRPHRPR